MSSKRSSAPSISSTNKSQSKSKSLESSTKASSTSSASKKQPKSVVPLESLPETLTFKEKISYLAQAFTVIAEPKRPIIHSFEQGHYFREMSIPAEMVFIGREHIHGHQVTLTKGSVLWVKPEGKVRVDAPFTVHTKPGDHMVVYTITDIECYSVHPNPTGTTDTDWLEDEYFRPAEELFALGKRIAAYVEGPA